MYFVGSYLLCSNIVQNKYKNAEFRENIVKKTLPAGGTRVQLIGLKKQFGNLQLGLKEVMKYIFIQNALIDI